jgi:hypothetical protein
VEEVIKKMQPKLSPIKPPSITESSEREKMDELALKLANLRSITTDFSTLTQEMKELNKDPNGFWYAMGSRLMMVVNNQLYRTAGYRSFSEYCVRGLGYSRQHAYKLINVVQFIDEQFSKAKTAEEKEMVRRLFSLGLTKLYILHSLPDSIINSFLIDGIEWTMGENQSVYMIPLESVTIEQLKHAIQQRMGSDVKRDQSPKQPDIIKSSTTHLNYPSHPHPLTTHQISHISHPLNNNP